MSKPQLGALPPTPNPDGAASPGASGDNLALASHVHALALPGLASIASAVAIANTETQVIGATILANTLAAGASFRIRCAGVGTTPASSAGSSIFRMRFGSPSLSGNIVTTLTLTNTLSKTAAPFGFEAIITVRTIGGSGTVIGECEVRQDTITNQLFGSTSPLVPSATTATVALATNANKILELTYISGAAGTTLTFHVATIERII